MENTKKTHCPRGHVHSYEWNGHPQCLICNRPAAKRYRERYRAQVYAHLGGKCSRCGFTDGRALQIDHVHGGSRPERRGTLSFTKVYAAILAGVPGEKYQLLCANCNWIKRFEAKEHDYVNWAVPHRKERDYVGNTLSNARSLHV